MDNQPTPPNSAGPEAGTPGLASTEGLQAGAPERAALPEAGAGVGAANAGQPAGTLPPKLTAADVAAAIAAVPGPGAPAPAVPGPVEAGDVDVIEPEWVAKAEDVVAQHQGDPYGEEEAIEDLQRDYLQKRYGHTVADPDADGGKPKGP
jgi:hypothetical protein